MLCQSLRSNQSVSVHQSQGWITHRIARCVPSLDPFDKTRFCNVQSSDRPLEFWLVFNSHCVARPTFDGVQVVVGNSLTCLKT